MNLLRPAKKGQLTNYALFITSRWFETIEDYANVERGCKRFLGNTSKFFYNPIPLTEQTREFFPNLQTLFIYNKEDNLFEEDKRIQRRIIQLYPYYLKYEQLKQIEEWTSKKCKEIIFDSEKDNWSINTSIFDSKIKGKKQLLFLIEDEQKELFGYYLHTEMVEEYGGWNKTDMNSFHFNLKSNGRLDGMMKFEIKNIVQGGYYLSDSTDYYLIQIGDICLKKEHRKEKSYCFQTENNFNYHNNPKALCGKEYDFSRKFEYFTPKRIIVIQMN